VYHHHEYPVRGVNETRVRTMLEGVVAAGVRVVVLNGGLDPLALSWTESMTMEGAIVHETWPDVGHFLHEQCPERVWSTLKRVGLF